MCPHCSSKAQDDILHPLPYRLTLGTWDQLRGAGAHFGGLVSISLCPPTTGYELGNHQLSPYLVTNSARDVSLVFPTARSSLPIGNTRPGGSSRRKRVQIYPQTLCTYCTGEKGRQTRIAVSPCGNRRTNP